MAACPELEIDRFEGCFLELFGPLAHVLAAQAAPKKRATETLTTCLENFIWPFYAGHTSVMNCCLGWWRRLPDGDDAGDPHDA
ncbi:MAG: hypothetical protein ACK5A0_04855 [Polaromonas sp.]|jgi:hypothetical protein